MGSVAQLSPAPVIDEAAGAAPSETAVLAGGCFWGVQGVYQHVGAGEPVGMQQDVVPANFVVEHIEAEGGLRLRLDAAQVR